MPDKKSRYADHLKEWEEITASAAANASELPQLELLRIDLESCSRRRASSPSSRRLTRPPSRRPRSACRR